MSMVRVLFYKRNNKKPLFKKDFVRVTDAEIFLFDNKSRIKQKNIYNAVILYKGNAIGYKRF